MGIWKTLRVSHIPTPPATTTNYGLTKRYTNIPLGTKDRSGHRLLAFFRSESVPEPLRELHVGAGVVLGERRISNHTVEFLDVAIFYKLGCLESVLKRNLSIIDVVEEHIHLADRPGGRVAVLPV